MSRYLPTIGIDYGATRIFVDKREVSIHIFDTSGSPIFAEVRNEFYRDTHGIVLAFDVCRRDTFDALVRSVTRQDSTRNNSAIFSGSANGPRRSSASSPRTAATLTTRS